MRTQDETATPREPPSPPAWQSPLAGLSTAVGVGAFLTYGLQAALLTLAIAALLVVYPFSRKVAIVTATALMTAAIVLWVLSTPAGDHESDGPGRDRHQHIATELKNLLRELLAQEPPAPGNLEGTRVLMHDMLNEHRRQAHGQSTLRRTSALDAKAQTLANSMALTSDPAPRIQDLMPELFEDIGVTLPKPALLGVVVGHGQAWEATVEGFFYHPDKHVLIHEPRIQFLGIGLEPRFERGSTRIYVALLFAG